MARDAVRMTEGWKAGSIYDTVELPWPVSNGSQYEFFRDIVNKQEVHCNLRMPRRIRAGYEFLLEGISVSLTHWSGDTVTEYLRRHGQLTFKINNRLIHSAPLTGMLDNYAHKVFEGEARPLINERDELEGIVQFQVSKAFPEPEMHDVKVEVVDETLVTAPTRWGIAEFLRARGLPTEIKRRTQTHHWISRPVKGLCLMKLTLHGQERVPLGR